MANDRPSEILPGHLDDGKFDASDLLRAESGIASPKVQADQSRPESIALSVPQINEAYQHIYDLHYPGPGFYISQETLSDSVTSDKLSPQDRQAAAYLLNHFDTIASLSKQYLTEGITQEDMDIFTAISQVDLTDTTKDYSDLGLSGLSTKSDFSARPIWIPYAPYVVPAFSPGSDGNTSRREELEGLFTELKP